MGKGGGGGVDTSGLEQATREATALQKEIYDLTREDVQPWYQMGVGSVNKLSDLLGISGGSVQNRDQIYNELMPQYTTQQTSGGGGNMYVTPSGKVLNLDDPYAINAQYSQGYGLGMGDFQNLSAFQQGSISQDELNQRLLDSGFSQLNPQTTTTTTDYDALNAAVEEQLAGQSTPDDYGSLLQTFGMDQFEEDPGYQFRKDEANKALERQMAAQGVTLGGGGYGEINPQAARAMEELSQGLASQEYGQAYNRYVNDQLNTYNMLMGTAGMGQNSTGIMASSGQNYATNVGNLQTGLASAQMNASLANQSSGGSFGTLLGAGIGGMFGGLEGVALGAGVGGSLGF